MNVVGAVKVARNGVGNKDGFILATSVLSKGVHGFLEGTDHGKWDTAHLKGLIDGRSGAEGPLLVQKRFVTTATGAWLASSSSSKKRPVIRIRFGDLPELG